MTELFTENSKEQ